MERLTTRKPVSEMGMYELAHNSCYIGKDGAARYRDFDTDIDARDFARNLMCYHDIWKINFDEMTNDDAFDNEIMENLQYGTTNIEGLIALFYRNLWAMAELYETLKRYEDAEEMGLFLKLPCKLGKNLYDITEFVEGYDSPDIYLIETSRIEISKDKEGLIYTIDGVDYREKDFGTSLFTSEEKALKAISEKGWIL